MSTTPKGPKPDDAGARPPAPKPGESPVRPNMDQTFLGVAPPAAPKTPSGSAIIAAPMIAVSGKPAARPTSTPPAAPPQQPAARASAPPEPQPQAGRSTQLGGGWQTSNVPPRGASPDRTLMHTSPQASPANPAARDRRPSEPAPAAPTRTPFPRPEAREAPVQQGGYTPAPAPARPPSDAPGNRTALASDYLRAARDAALGQAPPPQQPARDYAPPAQQREPQAHQHTPAPHQYQAPPQQQPAHYPPAAQHAEPPSSPAPVTVPPPTAPPDVVPPERPVTPAPAFSPAPAFASRDELEGPRSLGTQASVAPPLEGGYAPPARPSAPVVHQPPPPAPEPIRAAPRSIAGTMLEQPPSIPIKHAPTAPISAFSNSPSSVPAPAQVTRFEAVPSIRAPLADQPPASFGVSVQMDQSVAWDARGESTQPQKNKREGATPKAGSQTRLIALAAVAVLAIGFAAFSDQLKGNRTSKTASRPRPAETAAPAEAATETGTAEDTPTGQARLANRPSNETGEATQALTQAAPATPTTPTPAATAQPAVAEAPAAAAPTAEAEADAPAAAEEADAPVDDANATPESKMAAGAARHVIAGRYSEALPLYQQLEQSSPQNTAYAAMVRVLKQKTGVAAKSPATAP